MTNAKLKDGTATYVRDRHLIAGRYRVQTRVGHGRLGEIFTAVDVGYEDLGVGPKLAIQIVPESVVRNNRLFNKLNLGYTLLRAAAHPNIVNYRHYGRDGKFGFLVMDLLDGLSLRSVLDDAGSLTLDEVRAVIRGVGEALRLLHGKEMVHGNLTTKSVFITDTLEVRLLDVLPLDTAEPIIRGASTSEPFRRCTAEDDVFGLACLAYEMLAGAHPYNHCTPDEAASAGLEAGRVASLGEREWTALSVALSLDRQQRMSSVTEFMRDFGIAGTERLQRTADHVRERTPFVHPAMRSGPERDGLAVSPRMTATPARRAAVEPVPWVNDRPPSAPVTRKPPRPVRAVLLATLLAALGAWSYFGQSQDQLDHLFAVIDEKTNNGLTELSARLADVTARMAGPSESGGGVEPVAAAAPSETGIATRPEPGSAPAEPAITSSADEDPAAVAEPAEPPVPAAAPSADYEEKPANASDDVSVADADPAATAIADVQSGVQGAVAETVVSVSERDGAARVAAPPTGYSPMPLVWWTSEHTARADSDFIPVHHENVDASLNAEGDSLLVPLINDSLPELPESFFVNFGFRDGAQGRIDRISSIRVDIVDDD